MMSLAIILAAIFVIFGFALLPDEAYTDVPSDYCYDQKMEGYICLRCILEVLNKIPYFSLSRSNYTSIS